MTVGDIIVLGMVAVVGVWFVPMARRDHRRGSSGVILTSVPGLIVAATLFGMAAVGLCAYGVWCLVSEPGRIEWSHKVGDVHRWATGLLMSAAGAFVAYPGTLLLGKLRDVLEDRPAPEPVREPLAALPVSRDLAAARAAAIAALGTASTLDALGAVARGFLRDGHGAPPSGARDLVVAYLRERGVPADGWHAWLERLEAARYGGAAATIDEMRDALRALVTS